MPTHKRRVLSEDEEDDLPSLPSKISKKPPIPEHERFSSEEPSEPSASGFNSSNHDETHAGTITKSRQKRDRDDVPARSTAKRRRLYEDEGDEEDEFGAGLPDDYEDEDEFIDDDEVSKKKKSGPKAKATSKTKNERGKKSGVENPSTRQRSNKAKAKATAEEDMHVEVVKDSQPSASGPPSPNPSQAKPAAAPPITKKKLPTIRKIKGGAPDSPSVVNKPTPTATTPQQSLGLGTAPLRKLPHENPDINLNDSAVYNDLFKTVGQPRTSASKAKEDRKRELYRMRDEAKARRLVGTRPTFDLQAQSEKIANFEARLRAQRSGALYPNCLAAKWKESYERSLYTRRQVASEAEQEEGEVVR